VEGFSRRCHVQPPDEGGLVKTTEQRPEAGQKHLKRGKPRRSTGRWCILR
jgi:hypothetical protein